MSQADNKGRTDGRRAAEPGEKKMALKTLMLTTLLLAAGLAVVWLAQKHLDIKGDSIYIALLLVPVVVYLIISGEIGELKLPGVTLKKMESGFKTVRANVAEVGELEPERSTYLGKLRQVQDSKSAFYLIYADVAGLRTHTRQRYLHQKVKPGQGKKTEKEIRDEVIKGLGISLTDAFYDIASAKGAKHDLYFLEDPDVAMIVRGISLSEAGSIAREGKKRFAEEWKYEAKAAVCDPQANPLEKKPDADAEEPEAKQSPRDLDRRAAHELSRSV